MHLCRHATYTAFLVLEPFRDQVPEFRVLAAPLRVLGSHMFAGAEGYYSPALDTALIALRFRAAHVDRIGRERLFALISRGLPLLDPEKLAPRQRERFLRRHFAIYTTYVQHYPGRSGDPPLVDRVLTSLAEHVSAPPRRAPTAA